MKRAFFLTLAVCLLLSGCAAKTFYTQKTENGVRLFLKMPEAARVEIVSSDSGFTPRPAIQEKDGLWVATLPGGTVCDYFFLVDGQVFTPACALSRPDGFGGITCIFDPGM